MRHIVAGLVAAALAGCAGGVSKEEMDTLEKRLLANDAQMAANLRSELTGVDQKYVSVQQLQLKVEKQLDEMAKLVRELQELRADLAQKASAASASALKSLEFEERLMSDRLAQLRLLIEELKKAGPK
jgi:septum formation topological specificity factor MinE